MNSTNSRTRAFAVVAGLALASSFIWGGPRIAYAAEVASPTSELLGAVAAAETAAEPEAEVKPILISEEATSESSEEPLQNNVSLEGSLNEANESSEDDNKSNPSYNADDITDSAQTTNNDELQDALDADNPLDVLPSDSSENELVTPDIESNSEADIVDAATQDPKTLEETEEVKAVAEDTTLTYPQWQKGWIKSGVDVKTGQDIWYWGNADGTFAANQWVKSGNSWYWMGPNGVMVTSSKITANDGKYYYLNSNGVMASQNWVNVNNDKSLYYYATSSGALVSGSLAQDGTLTPTWYKDGASWYLFGSAEDLTKMLSSQWYTDSSNNEYYLYSSGVMATNWLSTDNTWYWMGSDGAKKKDQWLYRNSNWYYLSKDTGAIYTGKKAVKNTPYYFNESGSLMGAMRTGWIQLSDGSWYYATSSGALVSGSAASNGTVNARWAKVGSSWYLFGTSSDLSKMLSSQWYTDSSNNEYYLYSSGAMATNWLSTDNTWYWMGSDGAKRKNTWLSRPSGWYWLGSDGKMATGFYNANGKTYYSNSNGTMLTNWQKIDGAWYYFNNSGAMLTDWIWVSGKWYYLAKDGKMYSNLLAQFDANDNLVTNGEGAYWAYLASSGDAASSTNAVTIKDASGNNYVYVADSSCHLVEVTRADNWVYSNIAGDGSQWYYINPENRAARVGVFKVGDTSYYGTSRGYILRGTMRLGDGMLLATGSGALNTTASGWLYTGDYDGGKSHWYYMDNSCTGGLVGAHLGVFSASWNGKTNRYFGRYDKGYIVTGTYVVSTYYARANGGDGENIHDDTVVVADSSGVLLTRAQVGELLVAAAKSQLGCSYSYVDSGWFPNDSFNCSGLSWYVYYRALGVNLSHNQGYYSYYSSQNNRENSQTYAVLKRGGYKTSVSELQPGDLVFYSPVGDIYRSGHVGIYIGNGKCIDSLPSGGVAIRNAWRSSFVGGGFPITLI